MVRGNISISAVIILLPLRTSNWTGFCVYHSAYEKLFHFPSCAQVEVKVSRDPSRLFKLTAGLEERKKAGPGSGMTGAAPSMPKRAVPSWRQGV